MKRAPGTPPLGSGYARQKFDDQIKELKLKRGDLVKVRVYGDVITAVYYNQTPTRGIHNFIYNGGNYVVDGAAVTGVVTLVSSS